MFHTSNIYTLRSISQTKSSHDLTSVCFLTRLTIIIRICIMCRYLFSSSSRHFHTNLANFWSLSVSLALPSSNHFRLFSLFEQFRFHNAFAFLRQAEERYQVQQDCAGRSSDCRTSNHWRALYPYHHYYYYYYYNKNKWAVLVNGFGCSIFGIWGDSQGKWGVLK